jgi:predicted TIM-barrel fold metal-dependent hydrolase
MKFQIASLFFLASLCAGSSLAQPTPEEQAFAQKVPIADVHMHVYGRGGSQPAVLLPAIKRNNVRWGGGVGNYLDEMAAKLGENYIGTAGQLEYFLIFRDYGPSGLIDPENPLLLKLLEKAEIGFEKGTVKGFGELHTDNHNDLGSKIARAIRADNPAMRKMFQLASRYDGFVQIHVESSPQALEDILRLALDFPRANIVLSHCMPRSTPVQLAELFANRPNIYCEISATGPVHDVNGKGGRVFTKDGIDPRWKSLIVRFPDRFLLGTDPCCGLENRYDDMVNELRNHFLPALPVELQEKIAFKNAVQLFRLKE